MSFAGFGELPPDARRPRRDVPWFLLGGLSLLVVIAFFWWFADRDSATLQHGDRTTGTVVGLVQPADWDPMDSGRLVVRYEMYGETRQSKIWIDNDLSDYHLGQQVRVYVRGGHVRTDRENNDPAPLGTAAILLGLAGIGALIAGFVVRADRKHTKVVGDLTVLPLASWPFGRRPAIELTPAGEVRIRAPSFFGSKRLVVPATQVAVDALTDPFPGDLQSDDTFFFEQPLLMLDLPTKMQTTAPNLMLGFAVPVRVPPLRGILALQNPLPFTRRASRSTQGVFADAALLRSPDPQQAALALEAAGVTRVPDVVAWLATKRQVATDPVRIEQLRDADEHLARRSRYAFAAWTSAMALFFAAKWTESWWVIGAALLALMTGFALERRAKASADR